MKRGRPPITKGQKRTVKHAVNVPVEFDKEVKRHIKIKKYPSISQFYYMIGEAELKKAIKL